MQATLERLRARREELGDEGGFTLIELLIVIVILGILAAIVVFAVQNLTGQSAAASCSSNYKTVETAQESYKAQVGKYATNFATLETSATGLNGSSVGPWLKDTPPTAGDNGPYAISLAADGSGTITVTPSKAHGGKSNTAGGLAACANA